MAEIDTVYRNPPEGCPESLLSILLLCLLAKDLVADAFLKGAAAAKAETGQDKNEDKEPELGGGQLAST